jgi:proteasomal ATPase-associated factor 1
VLDSNDGSVRLSLKGHVGDITTAQFFPSGEVVLSTASDFTAKVWGLDGSNPVTLKGHTSSIVDAGIIARGRNVVTTGKDGTVKLWELASESVIYEWDLSSKESSERRSVNCISLGAAPESVGFPSGDIPADPREVDTKGKLAFVSCDNGTLYVGI